MAVIASTFHFPASEIMDMDAGDLRFWLDRADDINKRDA